MDYLCDIYVMTPPPPPPPIVHLIHTQIIQISDSDNYLAYITYESTITWNKDLHYSSMVSRPENDVK